MVWPRSPRVISAKPNRIENSSTCRISPVAKAPTTVSGMICRKKSTDLLGFRLLGKTGHFARVGQRTAETAARPDHIADDKSDHQCEGGDDLEIDQRLDADAADFLGILDMRYAGYHGAEDDRRDHHLDQFDEAVAERLDPVVGGEIGPQPADEGAEHDRDQNLHIENFVPGFCGAHGRRCRCWSDNARCHGVYSPSELTEHARHCPVGDRRGAI